MTAVVSTIRSSQSTPTWLMANPSAETERIVTPVFGQAGTFREEDRGRSAGFPQHLVGQPAPLLVVGAIIGAHRQIELLGRRLRAGHVLAQRGITEVIDVDLLRRRRQHE